MNSSVAVWGISTVLSRYQRLGPILSQSRSIERPALIASYSAADMPYKRDIEFCHKMIGKYLPIILNQVSYRSSG